MGIRRRLRIYTAFASPFPASIPKHEDELMALKQVLPELGKIKNATNEKAKRMLNWAPRSNEEAIISTARTLLELEQI